MKKTLLALSLLAGCCPGHEQKPAAEPEAAWQSHLEAQLPLLGHRNWIVVTDMAYPLQTSPGIQTLFAEEPYAKVVATVDSLIKAAPHVFAHVYQDSEQEQLSEELAPGWDDYRASMDNVFSHTDVQHVPHEELIQRLDQAGSLCKVVIIKTPLTLPYTSTFFELDCGYWDSDRESRIR